MGEEETECPADTVLYETNDQQDSRHCYLWQGLLVQSRQYVCMCCRCILCICIIIPSLCKIQKSRVNTYVYGFSITILKVIPCNCRVSLYFTQEGQKWLTFTRSKHFGDIKCSCQILLLVLPSAISGL